MSTYARSPLEFGIWFSQQNWRRRKIGVKCKFSNNLKYAINNNTEQQTIYVGFSWGLK